MFKNGISIRTKITLTPILLVAMVSIFIYTYYPAQQKRQAIDGIKSKIESIGNMFSICVGIGMGESDLVAISQALDWAKTDSSVVYISVANKKQEISLYNPQKLSLPQSSSFEASKANVIQNQILYCKSDIVYQTHVFGSLLIGYSLGKMESNISRLRTTTLYFCLGFFSLGGLISLSMSNRITNNIRKLSEVVTAISGGDQQAKMNVNSNDEIGKLATAFNQMIYNVNQSKTELINYSEQLQRQNQELNQFSYVVSHDLKSPLRAIYKLSEWIEEDLGVNVPEQTLTNLRTLQRRIFRLEALINGLLEYSKIGRIDSKDEKVDVKEMLDEIIDLLNPLPKFKINIQSGLPVFVTKKIILQQVFFNLLSNAIKYNDKELGIITIKFFTSGKFYEFSVGDNGIGIDPLYHEKVFVIFQTIEAKDKVEATGVGLSIVKKSVEDMGGKVHLQSTLTKGSKFNFTWPKQSLA